MGHAWRAWLLARGPAEGLLLADVGWNSASFGSIGGSATAADLDLIRASIGKVMEPVCNVMGRAPVYDTCLLWHLLGRR